MLLEFQDRHADGAVTLGMVMSHLCCRAQQCSAESTREETRLRVCTDRALMHLQRVVSSARRYGLLQEAFVCAGLWRHVPLDRLRVRQLWMTMLIPSTNQNLAERIADLMVCCSRDQHRRDL